MHKILKYQSPPGPLNKPFKTIDSFAFDGGVYDISPLNSLVSKANAEQTRALTGYGNIGKPAEESGRGLLPGDGSGWAKGIGIANSTLSPLMGLAHENSRYADDQNANLQNSVRGGIADAAIQSGNPIAMAIGLGTKLVDAGLDATGLRADNINKTQADKIGISGATRFLNNSMNFLPGNPLAMGGKPLSDSEKSLDTEKVRGAFAGTLDDIDAAQGLGGSRLNFMVGNKARNKAENYIQTQNMRNDILSEVSRTNTLRQNNNYSQNIQSQNNSRYGGYSASMGTAVGKEGLKLLSKEELLKIYNSKSPIENSIKVFKDGGVIGIDSNVIPEGALHKELNHMEDHNDELDKVITDKGIAVVVTDKEGNIEQVAEIEKEEIVLRLELTKKLEELWHDGSEKAMLEAGKLLTKEIVGNTDDNTEEMLNGDN